MAVAGRLGELWWYLAGAVSVLRDCRRALPELASNVRLASCDGPANHWSSARGQAAECTGGQRPLLSVDTGQVTGIV